MGWYQTRVFPWILDRSLSDPKFAPLREEALSEARGRVLELGFGTGLNLAHYPPSVTRIAAIDPNQGMDGRARQRMERSAIQVDLQHLRGEALPYADASFDTVAATFTLCSIPDVAGALGEVRRVLAPGGRLLLLEHGLSDDPAVRRWQRRLDPINQALACGCHLDRDIRALVQDAGFAFERLRNTQLSGEFSPFGYLYLGVAIRT
jgi:SAM-dependent methyltransferase